MIVSMDEDGHLHHGDCHDVDDDGDGVDDDGDKSRQTWTKMVLTRHRSTLVQ